MAAPGSNRARARSAENNAPKNPRQIRISDMPWFSVSITACTPQFWPRHDGNRTDADVDPNVLRQCYPIIDQPVCDQDSRSGRGASEWCRELGRPHRVMELLGSL